MSRLTVRATLALFLLVTGALTAQDMPAVSLPNPPAEPTGAATPNPPPLTLDECVAQALEKNFNVRIQRFSTEQARDSVIIAKSSYDPTLNLDSQKSVTKGAALTDPATGQIAGGLYTNNEATTLSVSQKIPTGGTLSANSDLNRDRNVPSSDWLNPAYTSDVSLSLTQPLLQGAGVDYNLAAIKRAKLGVQIADLNFKSTVLTVIFNVETAYFNLIFAREQYKVQEDSLRLAQELYKENDVKRQTGVLTDLDVLQAQVGVATANSQLILDEQTVHNDEDILLQSLSQRDFSGQVGPVDFPVMASDPEVSFDLSYKLARDNGPNLAIIQATIEQFKLDALTTKRNALPELDVNGAIGYNSLGKSYSGALNQVLDDHGHSWQAGVTLNFPIGLRANRALYHQALASQHSEETTFEQEDENLTVQVRSAVRAVQTGIESVRASTETATLSEKQYELEKAKFDAGLVTSLDVLTEQNALLAARVQELQAKVNLRTAIANLRFLEGSSLQLYHVNLVE
ncbi:MAG TPA: TolC family protein [Opitutaceae bacterium]|jgi:outer membrane protein TolC|nr:TolC family protein [Opitutaceae bacterium]